MGSFLGKFGVVELRRLSSEMESVLHLDDATEDLVDSLAAVQRADTTELRMMLGRIVERDTMMYGIVVASTERGLIASSIADLSPSAVTVGPGRRVTLRRVVSEGGMRSEMRIAMVGRLLDPDDDADPRMVLLVPRTNTELSVDGTDVASPSERLTRRVGMALLVGSVVAALLTVLLSGRLTGRIEQLAVVTRDLGRGNLGARVPVAGGDEIADLATSFNEMAESLEKSESQRRQMVSDVAHELRTPLTNVVGLLEAARDGLRPIDDELIEVLQEEASLLRQLVEDLSDLALADAGDLALALGPVDIVAAVRSAVAGFDHRLQIKTVFPESPTTTVADPRRLGQIIRNLVQNAVTHSTDPGTVTVTVACIGGIVGITVSDHGTGIAPEHLDRIWERFYRVDPSRDRLTGGMGIGLSVAKRLIELMGGTISVESALGEGTTFAVQLPHHRGT
jgi:signal transduction histidine kinase